MKRVNFKILPHVCVILVACCAGRFGILARPASAPAATAGPPEAVLKTYCFSCHNERLKTAGLTLDTMDLSHVAANAERWERVVRRLRAREMPPAGMPRPDDATYSSTISWLESELDSAAAANPNPARVPIHRLNRTEYANVVRDLFGIEIDARAILPGDVPDRQNFDNMASVLSVSPALLENYLSAAFTVSRLAVGDLKASPPVTYRVPTNLTQDDRMAEDLPFGSQGGTVIRHYFPQDGRYIIKVRLRRQLYDYIIGMGEPHDVDIRVDGVGVKHATIGGEAKGMTAPENFPGDTMGDLEWEDYMHTADAGLEVAVPVKAGMREVAVVFARSFWEREGVVQPPQIESFARTDNELYFENPGVGTIAISALKEPGGEAGANPNAKVFTCRPKPAESGERCARQILSTIATRAYRRPVTDREVKTLVEFYKDGHAEAGFEAGIQRGIERILAAPRFLFRVEAKPAGAAGVYRLSDLDLASRLSFFLWSSVPDDELLNLAVREKLHDPATLENQLRRMLRDSRAKAMVDNFATQWLKLDSLSSFTPDIYEYPDFDENLRQAMLEESRLFIASQLQEDHSVLDLLTANYTFLNERLAKHYQIPNVYGSHFRRVTFDNPTRGGLLAEASILTVTSYPNRTSPVLRGKWLLDNILGSPIPPPPPNVPALKEGGEDGQPRSVRERMELHRQNPVCAGCHQRMDPLGFSLENFDALGKWRETSDGATIDATASLVDGTRFQGLSGLRTLLVNRREQFVRALTEKLLAYALGRGVEYFDYPAIRKIMKDADATNYRWSSLIIGITKSTPFSSGVASEVAPGGVK